MKKRKTKERHNGMDENRNWMQKTVVVWFGAMICCALWGSAFPFIKIGYRLFSIAGEDTAAQILFAGYRFTLAGVLTILIGSVLTKQILLPDRGSVGKIIWLSMLQTVLQYLFFYIGLANTSGVKASIIEAVNVFVAILVASLIFKQENLNMKKIVGCIVGFLGVILINLTGLDFGFKLSGEGCIVLSTVAYSFSTVFMKKYSVKHNPVMLSGYQFIAGGVIMCVVGLVMGGHVSTSTGRAIGLLIYLALVSAVAYSIWGLLLKYNPVSRVTVFGFMNPVFGVILSAILLNEKDTLGLLSIFSLVLVCIGIYVVNKK